MAETDPFQLNIAGVADLVETDTNKVFDVAGTQEGIASTPLDALDIAIPDEELQKLKKQYEDKSASYMANIEARQKQNKRYLFGTQQSNGKVIPSNLIFQSTATFVPQALAKNPEPVVWSDNTPEGKTASTDLKTMLQFHADVLCLRKKLGLMVWDWSVYFIGVWKYGWNEDVHDVLIEIRNPKHFVFDPDGYVDEYGDYRGEYLGERIKCTATELIARFPKAKESIEAKLGLKLGTLVTYTEWWNNEFCFVSFEDLILDKHKNPFFNYDEEKLNHFSSPKMPYTFLSVFSLQEQPHDFTNLVEQNIANQDRIVERDRQITKNLAHSNNAILLDNAFFNVETGKEAADAIEAGDPILAPKGSVERLAANAIPQGVFEAQDKDKETLLSVYGTLGTTAQSANEDTTARGMILNQSFDNTRIGGGVGDALEQVADNAFNWLTQLYYVFYDEAHYASILGKGRAVEYTTLSMTNASRRYVVSVSPNSMKPHDELSEQNLAMERWTAKAIDPINFMKAINDADPMESAKALVLWTTNPTLYAQTYFPETQGQAPEDSANPSIPAATQAPEPPAGAPTLSEEPANASLSTVPLPK